MLSHAPLEGNLPAGHYSKSCAAAKIALVGFPQLVYQLN